MAICGKCERTLSANGTCLHCGTLVGLEATQARRRKPDTALTLWIKNLVKLALAGALLYGVYYIYFTAEGQKIVEKVRDAIGLRSEEDDPAVAPFTKPIRKYAKVSAFMKREVGRDVRVILEDLGMGDSVKMVTVVVRDGADLKQAGFRVNLDTGSVEPQDAEARELMSE